MIKNDIELKLLANIPIQIDGIGEFQLPILREMIAMGESTYQQRLALLLFSKGMLGDDEEIHQYSDYEVLMHVIYQDEQFRGMLFDAFKTFLNSEPNFLEGVVYFDELSEDSIFTEEKWDYLKKVIKVGNYIQDQEKTEEFEAGNERARKFMEMIRKKKAEAEALKKKNEKINMHSIISAVGWRLNDIDKVLNKTIYQLYDAYYRLGFIDNFNFINTGIYTGNIDQKSIKLADINWANIIKI